jgi:O-antigen/teichoic acid export membrane protein
MTTGPTPPDAATAIAERLAPSHAVVRLWTAAHAWLNRTTDQRLIQRNALFAFAIRVASAGLLYLSQVILARWMGASEFGVYVLIWTWVLVLGGVSHLGLSMVMIRLVPHYRETGEAGLLRGLLRAGRLTALGVGTLIAALGMAGLYTFGHRLEPQTLTDLQDGIGRGHGWMGAALVPPYILRPLVLLLGMALAHAVGLTMAAATAAAVAILATWLAAFVQTRMVQNRLPQQPSPAPRRYALATWLKIAAPLLLIYAAELVMQNADIIILAAYLPPSEVGMYFAAAKTMALVMFVHYAVGSAAAHRFSILHARGDREGLIAAVRDAVRWTFFPSLAAAVVILALGRPLLWLFSPQFTAAYPVMVILVVGFLARAAVGPAEFLLNVMGEQKMSALVAVTSAATNIVLNLILIPRYGMFGAAAATAGALVFAAFANAAVARQRLGLEISIFQHLRR